MNDLFKTNLHNSIINSLKHDDRFKKASTANEVANKISDIVITFRNKGEENTINMLEEESSQKIFRFLGIKTDNFLQFIKASINQDNSVSYKLRLTEVSERLLNKLLRMQDRKQHCWYFRNRVEDDFFSTAWDTATCIYALHKINNYLKNRQINDHIYSAKEAVINKRIESALKWLFDTPIFNHGWSDKRFYSSRNDNILELISPKLIDTAYILNIIIRVKPVYRKNIESILVNILRFYNPELECWVSPRDKSNIDFIRTSYCLRLLSAFIKYASDSRTNILWMLNQKNTNEIMKIRHDASSKMAMLVHENDWGCGQYWKSNSKDFSDAQTTSLCILSLISCGFTYKDDIIQNSCEWLLNEMVYFDGAWCWTEKKSDGTVVQSISETALIVSALLKSGDRSVIAKLEGVFLWLIDKINENYLNDMNEVKNFAPLLCVFSEYLKFLDD